MRKAIIAGLAFGALVGPAAAADLYVKAPPVAPCIWCGFYIGANAGGTWSSDNSVSVTSALAQDMLLGPGSFGAASAAGATGNLGGGGGSGFIGGGQFGYNWQTSSAWLVGFETDIQGVSSGKGNGTVSNTSGAFPFFGAPEVVNTSIATSQQLEYLGTVRGRLGYLYTPTFLLFGTGGLAYGGVKASTAIAQTNNDCIFFPATCISPTASAAGAFSQTRVGWTAGAGFEWMFAQRWSAKLEYLYYDLGSVTYGNSPLVTGPNTFAVGTAVVNSASSADFKGNIVRVGINYHW
jgi:outer membrane immunogenic protein